jgi:hypothetical protein
VRFLQSGYSGKRAKRPTDHARERGCGARSADRVVQDLRPPSRAGPCRDGAAVWRRDHRTRLARPARVLPLRGARRSIWSSPGRSGGSQTWSPTPIGPNDVCDECAALALACFLRAAAAHSGRGSELCRIANFSVKRAGPFPRAPHKPLLVQPSNRGPGAGDGPIP